jgi:thioredoxin-dependent peroxiredoxin
MLNQGDIAPDFLLKDSNGKTYMGIIRSTFIIDEKARIIKVFPKVKPEKHGEEVLNTLRLEN